MKNEALALELLNDMNSFINDLVDEFGTEGTISHDTFNKAVELKYRVIADSDLWEGNPVPDNHSECNKHIVNASAYKNDLLNKMDSMEKTGKLMFTDEAFKVAKTVVDNVKVHIESIYQEHLR